MQALDLGERHAALGVVFQVREQGSQFVPIRLLGGDEARQVDNHSTCLRLTSRYCAVTSVLIRSGCTILSLTPRLCSASFRARHAVPQHLAGESLVRRVDVRRRRIPANSGVMAEVAGDVDQDEVAPREEGNLAVESFGQQGVVVHAPHCTCWLG